MTERWVRRLSARLPVSSSLSPGSTVLVYRAQSLTLWSPAPPQSRAQAQAQNNAKEDALTICGMGGAPSDEIAPVTETGATGWWRLPHQWVSRGAVSPVEQAEAAAAAAGIKGDRKLNTASRASILLCSNLNLVAGLIGSPRAPGVELGVSCALDQVEPKQAHLNILRTGG